MLEDDFEPEVVLVNGYSLEHMDEFLELNPGILWNKVAPTPEETP